MHLPRTRVNSALEELEDRLLDRGVPFDSYVGYALETLASAISPEHRLVVVI